MRLLLRCDFSPSPPLTLPRSLPSWMLWPRRTLLPCRPRSPTPLSCWGSAPRRRWALAHSPPWPGSSVLVVRAGRRCRAGRTRPRWSRRILSTLIAPYFALPHQNLQPHWKLVKEIITQVCNWFHILCLTYIHMAKHFFNKLMNCTDLSNYPDLLVLFSLWYVNSLVFKWYKDLRGFCKHTTGSNSTLLV